MKCTQNLLKIGSTAIALMLFLMLAGSLMPSSASAKDGDPDRQNYLEGLLWNYCLSQGGYPGADYNADGTTIISCYGLPGGHHFNCILYPSGNSACIQELVVQNNRLNQTAIGTELTVEQAPADPTAEPTFVAVTTRAETTATPTPSQPTDGAIVSTEPAVSDGTTVEPAPTETAVIVEPTDTVPTEQPTQTDPIQANGVAVDTVLIVEETPAGPVGDPTIKQLSPERQVVPAK